MSSKRILIVGGVAGDASCAARLRRLDEAAEIFLYERGPDVSFANCGLPYYVGGVIEDRQKLLVATPERFRDLFRIEVRTNREVTRIDRQRKTVENLHRRGLDVVVLERLDQIMVQMDPEMVAPVHGLLRSKGVALRLSESAVAFPVPRRQSTSQRPAASRSRRIS